ERREVREQSALEPGPERGHRAAVEAEEQDAGGGSRHGRMPWSPGAARPRSFGASGRAGRQLPAGDQPVNPDFSSRSRAFAADSWSDRVPKPESGPRTARPDSI